MVSKIVTFSRADSEWLLHIGDSGTYIFEYTVVESEHKGKPEEKSYTQEQSVKVDSNTIEVHMSHPIKNPRKGVQSHMKQQSVIASAAWRSTMSSLLAFSWISYVCVTVEH